MNDSLDNLTTFDPEFEPSAAELKEGQFLGENRNYRLEKNLGVGGMGEVWLAAEIRAGQEIRKVVVKTLRPDRRGNEGAQEKALKQFQLIQSLNHQNICPIYVIEKDPACGYLIVMGYAGGGSFADWFAGQPKPLAEVSRVLRPIADALDFAHSKGVIHRDVKPSNMMFTSDQTPWLIDFGIASNLRTATQATTGQYGKSGTDSYMAPEQKSGQLQTEQTDEYSLALVALEFLTGMPFLQAIQKLPLEIQPILNKALALEPSDRYATCRAFIDALTGTTHLASATERKAREDAERKALSTICVFDGTVLKKYKGTKKHFTIPDWVTEIGYMAFYGCRSLTSVVIPEGVTVIECCAFMDCRSLTSVVIPEGVTVIEAQVFYGCRSLTSVVIPKGVTKIEARVFYGCRSLTSVVIPEGVTEIGYEAFSGCATSGKTLLSTNGKYLLDVNNASGEFIIPDSVKVIGSSVFLDCRSLTSVVIPEGVTVIGDGAFRGCRSLTSMVIPEGVTVIGYEAFKDCSSLTSVVIPEGVTVIGSYTFSGCSSLTSVAIPDSVQEIKGGAFAGCKALKEWRISPDHPYFKTDGTCLLTKDGKKLVACLPSATKYRIPEGVTVIGEWAFDGCRSLTSVVIPEGVTEIGYRAFSGCSSLMSVVIPEDVTVIGWSVFSGCSSLTSVVIPEGVTEIGANAFSGCRSLTSVVIPEGVTEIGGYAFSGCRSLTSVVIPEGVTEIEDHAFDGCRSVTSVVIPESVTKIWYGAFRDCRSLTSVVIPESVIEIRASAFSGCRSLASVVIPESVTWIGEGAFGACFSLKSVVIPGSVKSVDLLAFIFCPKLKIKTPFFSYVWWRLVFLNYCFKFIGITILLIVLYYMFFKT